MKVVLLLVLSVSLLLSPASASAWVTSSSDPSSKVLVTGDADYQRAESRTLAKMIVAERPDRFLYLGDVYDAGSAEDFATRYQPLFGALGELTAPTIGNHESDLRKSGYEPYWGQVHGFPVPAYYSFRLSGWQLLSLSSEDPHDAGSAQLNWLQRRLKKTSRRGDCRIAFWHRPRFSAGPHGDAEDMEPVFDLLRGRARLALSGHDHSLQRFKPSGGIIQLVAGAGGHQPTEVEADPRLDFASENGGAVRLVLRKGQVRWQFLNPGGKVIDRGVRRCHLFS